MKKVKYVSPIVYSDDSLTIGKIYDVLKYTFILINVEGIVSILDDNGNIGDYFMRNIDGDLFIDATIEYRDGVINDILE